MTHSTPRLHSIFLCTALATIALQGCGSNGASPGISSDAGIDAAPSDGAMADGATTDTAASSTDTPDAPDAPAPALVCNPLAITAECLPPYPNDFMTRADPTTPTGIRLALPAGALVAPPGRNPLDLSPFNIADGFPTSEPILVHYGVPVAATALVDDAHTVNSLDPAAPIALFNATTGDRVPYLAEMDQNLSSGISRSALIIRPLNPLAYATRYIVLIRRDVTAADGSPLPVSMGFAALRDATPSPDPRIESARPRFEALFTFLAAHGYPRANLGLAWDYTTASTHAVLGPALAMRDAAFALADGAGVPYTIDTVADHPTQWAARTVIGSFTPPNYLRADNTIAYGTDGLPIRQPDGPTYPFTVVIPNIPTTGPLPLVMFGHGVFGSGRDYLVGNLAHTIQPIAQASGAVLVATDWIGLSSTDQSLLVSQVVPDINRIGIVTDRLLQSLVNNVALEELALGALQRDPMVHTGTVPLIDTSRVYYYGVSLGGIQGVGFTSLSRHITRGVFAVPGGSWSNILQRSTVYAPIKALLDVSYPDQLTQTEFITLLQGRFDHTDGVNLGTMLLRAPPTGAPMDRTFLIQESYGDCEVPNLSTEILSRAIGMQQLTPALYTIFGLNPVTSPQTTSVLAQYAVESDIMAYFPPTTDVVPTRDNGAHADMVTLPNALHQVENFLSTGTVQQYCTAACMPD